MVYILIIKLNNVKYDDHSKRLVVLDYICILVFRNEMAIWTILLGRLDYGCLVDE